MSERKMKKRQNKASAKRLLVLVGILLVCVYATCVFVKQQITLSQCEDLAKEYEEKIAEAELEQQKLKDELEQAGTDEYIQRAAREKLGLVKANERVFIDISEE